MDIIIAAWRLFILGDYTGPLALLGFEEDSALVDIVLTLAGV